MEDNERMRLKTALRALVVACALVAAAGCRQEAGNTNAGGAASVKPTPSKKDAAALPENGFKAQISVADPPAKLRAGQKATLQVKVKNVSDAQWYARGGEVNTFPDNRFYIAAGDRWLKADGQTLVTNMDGRYGLQRDLKPGEEEDVPLQITAPKEPGDYVLEVDLIQEQVAWFSDKGSPTARVKVTVVR
ncbi:MAG: hypothetical protein DMF67_12785 [Acidobacteria bacterium]|nr:MAG: hypothetical protein DMF67_12785 [Acidobacteriota bacterium]